VCTVMFVLDFHLFEFYSIILLFFFCDEQMYGVEERALRLNCYQGWWNRSKGELMTVIIVTLVNIFCI